jgi:surface polysaccharide O-acyltransferase-like enzyme
MSFKLLEMITIENGYISIDIENFKKFVKNLCKIILISIIVLFYLGCLMLIGMICWHSFNAITSGPPFMELELKAQIVISFCILMLIMGTISVIGITTVKAWEMILLVVPKDEKKVSE